MRKRVLVTGGAGFIGGHLCSKLLREGNEVICLDNFFTGNRENVIHLLKSPYFELVRHDVCSPYFAEVDQIYNLACPASPVYYKCNAIKTIKSSVLGAMNMLGLAKRVEAVVLQASTSEVYGDPQQHPQSENYWGHVNPIGSRSCYDEGKRCAESLFVNYHLQNKVKIKIVRIFNTYGERMKFNDGRVVSNFIVQALKGNDITLYGDGSQTRSFMYVDDLVNGLILMMNTPDNIIGPINLGNDNEIRISELARKIIDLTGSKSKIVHLPLSEDDPSRRCPSISMAKNVLGWAPSVTLDEGLKKTIGYFNSILTT